MEELLTDDFFEGIEDVEVSKLKVETEYICYIVVYCNHAIEFERNRNVSCCSFKIEDLSANNIISKCKGKNKNTGIILENSKALKSIDLKFIEDFEIKYRCNTFNFDTQFCSLKTQNKYHIRILIGKNQSDRCCLDLPCGVGYKHNFYSYFKEYCGIDYF